MARGDLTDTQWDRPAPLLIGLRGYLDRGGDAYTRHIAPMRRTAGLVLDGTRPARELVQQVVLTLKPDSLAVQR